MSHSADSACEKGGEFEWFGTPGLLSVASALGPCGSLSVCVVCVSLLPGVRSRTMRANSQ